MKKAIVNLTVKLVINMDDDAELFQIIDDMFYEFISNSPNGDIEDSQIEDFELVDSK